MADAEQLDLLIQGADVWNRWRAKNRLIEIDLRRTILYRRDLSTANLSSANLFGSELGKSNFSRTDFSFANLKKVTLANSNLKEAILINTDLSGAVLTAADFNAANLAGSNFFGAQLGWNYFGDIDLSEVKSLAKARHEGPSTIGTNTLAKSKGKIPESFLRGCGLSDWEIEVAKLYSPDLSNNEINDIQYKLYELRAINALQISPLFISYSHEDSIFVDKIGENLTEAGIRFWRDIHDMKAGRMEKQIDRAIRQNPTVLLILSKNSLKSDWVEHEVHRARQLEKDMGRDVLCPIALDDSWKDSKWEKRMMEQVTKYNILDFSEWKDESKFSIIFRKLIDGLELFYKG